MKTYEEEYRDRGFCIIKNVIPDHTINVVKDSLMNFKSSNIELLSTENLLVNGMFQRVVNLHHSVSSLKDIFVSAVNSANLVCDKYSMATLYTSLFFELGSQQTLHRDTPYFYSGIQEGYMGIWAALDDVDENNGALIVVEGSHELPEPNLDELKFRFFPNGVVPKSSTPLFNAYNDELINLSLRKNLSTVICNVKKGDVILWNPSTLHGGLMHKDLSRTRSSFVMHVTPKNMPIHHMDFFFDRSKPILPIHRDYSVFKNRLILVGDMIDFAHIKSFSVSKLGIY
jgi:phytanoyl-CoA hydroxylase